MHRNIPATAPDLVSQKYQCAQAAGRVRHIRSAIHPPSESSPVEPDSAIFSTQRIKCLLVVSGEWIAVAMGISSGMNHWLEFYPEPTLRNSRSGGFEMWGTRFQGEPVHQPPPLPRCAAAHKGRAALTSAAVIGDGQSRRLSAIFIALGVPHGPYLLRAPAKMGRNQLRTYLLNQSIVRCQARSAAALL